jgi:hypothetical protein
VLEFVGRGDLHSAADYFNAALVLQHGEKPEDFLLSHELATAAAFKGNKEVSVQVRRNPRPAPRIP